MTRTTWRLLWAGVLVACGVFCAGPTAAQAPDPRLQKVFADWEKRQERIKRVRYTIVGEAVTPKGKLTGESDLPGDIKGEFPPRDVVTPKSIELLIDFPNNRYRAENSSQELFVSQGQFSPRVTTTVFNGKEQKTAIPREANSSPVYQRGELDPDVSIISGNLALVPVDALPSYWPVFFSHGVVPTDHAPLRPDRLRIKPNPEIWSVRGQGVHAGRRCLVLRTEALKFGEGGSVFDECWVDLERDSAVVRHIGYSDDGRNAWFDWDIQYQMTPYGWLPTSWTWTHSSQRKTRRLERLRVQEFAVDPPITDQDFDVEIKPGMIVLTSNYTGDPRRDMGAGNKKYRVGADGRWNEIVNGVEQKRAWPGLIAWGIGLGGAAGLGLWLVRRQRHRRVAVSGLPRGTA